MKLPHSLSHSDRSRRARHRHPAEQRRSLLRHLRLEGLEHRRVLAAVAVFDDPGFVDTANTPADESDNIQASIAAHGHTVNTFTGTTEADLDGALSTNEILVIPELANGDLSASLSAGAIAEITNFVSSGGGLIIAGTGPFATGIAEATHDVDFLNTVFGFSITDGGDDGGTGSALTGAEAGTTFVFGPANLDSNSGTSDILPGSLPAGGASIYEEAGESTVALVPFGEGQIVYLGWDWFQSDPPSAGLQDGGWQEVLGRALNEVTPTDPVITGTPADDDILVRRSPSDSDLVEVLVDDHLEYTFTYETLESLTVLGQDGNDALTVDVNHGDPVPQPDGILFEGGIGEDELLVQGDGRHLVTSRPSATTAGEGDVRVGAGTPITYTGLEPVTVSRTPHVVFITGGSADDVQVDSPSPFVTEVSGTSDGVPFETHTLYNVGELTVDARTNDTGDRDVLVIDRPQSDGLGGRIDESEPNDTALTSDSLFVQMPFGHGEIDPIGDIDYWRSVGEAGDLLFAYVDTSQSTTGTDSVLQVLDDAQMLIESDDDDGPGLTSVVAGAPVPIDGDVFFRINEFADNDTITPYRLYQAIISPEDSDDEVEGNDSLATATPLAAPLMSGRVGSGDTDYFSMFAAAGTEIVVMADDDPDDDGIRTNILIELLDSDGTVLESSTTQALQPLTAPDSDTYFVRITSMGGTEDDYRLVAKTYDPQPHAPTFLDRTNAFSGPAIDNYFVTPSLVPEGIVSDAKIFINGDAPTSDPGDVLAVNLRGVSGAEVPQRDSADGSIRSLTHDMVEFRSIEQLIVTDQREGNGTLEAATVLGSLKKITLNDLSIDAMGDVDWFQYTAQDTGKLILNAHFSVVDVAPAVMGNLDLFVHDSDGNLIASSETTTDDEQIVIPVVSQQQYFIRIEGATETDVNNYDLEIENFRAPVPNVVDLVSADDSGMSARDDVTNEDQPQLLVEADLTNFAAMGIDVLDPAVATAGDTPGAAVEVFVDGSSIGFAEVVAGTNLDLYSIELAAGDLAEGDNLVKAAVRIFDGQATSASDRTTLSEPLVLTLDTTAPEPSTPDLLAASDTGAADDDDITSITSPAFTGIAEANAKVRVYANGELVGQGIVGSDGTDGDPDNGLGRWEVTVEPLDDGTYEITTEIEDLAGNSSALEDSPILLVEIDSLAPQRPTIDLVGPDVIDPAPDLTGDPAAPVVVDPVYSDTGISTSDNVTAGFGAGAAAGTRAAQYRISAEPGSEVWIKDGEEVVASFTMPAAPFVFYTLEQDEDPHPLSVEAFDAAGNRSAQSEELLVRVDATAPDPGGFTFDLLATSDTGQDDSDNVTGKDVLALAGNAEALSQVRVFVGGDATVGSGLPVGSALAGSDQTDGTTTVDPPNTEVLAQWQISTEPLADGGHDLWAEVEDAAGNLTRINPMLDPAMPEVDVWVDTVAPNTPLLDLTAESDTGRSDVDNITMDATPAVTVTADDNLIDGDGNPFPNDVIVRIFDRPGDAGSNGERLLVDTFAGLPGFSTDGFFTFTLSDLFNDDFDAAIDGAGLADGVHDLKVEVEDRAGNLSHDFQLSVTIDTAAPAPPSIALDPATTDSNIAAEPATLVDALTRFSTAGFVGAAEADAVVRLFGDAGFSNGLLDDEDVFQGLTVALPEDGNAAFPDGQWNLTGQFDWNDPDAGFPRDGLRQAAATAEDVAGNVSEAAFTTFFVDTTPPVVTDVQYENLQSVFAPKPAAGPTPRVDSLLVSFDDFRTAGNLFGNDLSGENEVPPVTTPAIVAPFTEPPSGNATLHFDPDSGTFDLLVTASGFDLTSAAADNFLTGAHIHVGADDVAGPIIFDLGGAGDWQAIGGGMIQRVITGATFPAANVEDLLAGDTYVNLHTNANPAGEIRGQLTAQFDQPAVNLAQAIDPSNYRVMGDHGGVVSIESVELAPDGDPEPGKLRVRMKFAEPLPDDRFALSLFDSLSDQAGNSLDGDLKATEPGTAGDLLPSGDAVVGGDFAARFTIDSRPEIGMWGQGNVWTDINGNLVFDPEGQDNDATNRDFIFKFGLASDAIFAGNFAPAGAGPASGFDKLGAYGFADGSYRFLLDTDDDGVADTTSAMPAAHQVNGIPVAGDFALGHAGDEIGLFDGRAWYLDTNGNNRIDVGERFASDLRGLPVVGDFNGDGEDDLATFNNDTGRFFFDTDRDGDVDDRLTFGFTGFGDIPVAGDLNLDGIDDIGAWAPGREGQVENQSGEFHFLVSDGPSAARPSDNFDPYGPAPLGNDLYAQFGDDFAVPVFGNFDPPVAANSGGGSGGGPAPGPNNRLDVNEDGQVTALDALLVINQLHRQGAEAEQEETSTSLAQPLAAALRGDTSGDGRITALDALLVINHLHRQGSGESDSVAAATTAESWAERVDVVLSASEEDEDEAEGEDMLLEQLVADQLR